MKKQIAAAVAVSAALALSSCSTSSPTTSPSAPSGTSAAPSSAATSASTPSAAPVVNYEHGDYFFVTPSGTVGKFTVPGPPAADIEAVRKLASAKAVQYVRVKIDNRKGQASVSAHDVKFYDAAGKVYEFTGADATVDRWRQADAGLANDTAKYNQFIEAANKYSRPVEKLAVGESLLVSEGPALPASFTGVKVTPGDGSDPVDAYPVEMLKLYGSNISLDF